MISIFPVVGNAGVSQDEADQLSEARFSANVVGEDQNAALSLLEAHQRIGCLPVVAALVKTMALGAIKYDDAQSSIQVFALFAQRARQGERVGTGLPSVCARRVLSSRRARPR